MDNALQVGKKLVELCRAGKNKEAIETLYAANSVSIEPMGGPDMPARMEGIDAIRGKNQWWVENHQVHKAEAFGPYPHGDRFIVHFKYDVTGIGGKMKGQRLQIDETALYTVKDGKVVKEEFFYDMGG